MPLHPNAKGACLGIPDTFDYPIRSGNALDFKTGRDLIYSLSVERIYHYLTATTCFVEHPVFCSHHEVTFTKFMFYVPFTRHAMVIEAFHFVHAGSEQLLILTLVALRGDAENEALRCEWRVVARDGVSFTDGPRETEKILLGPGSRADVVIWCEMPTSSSHPAMLDGAFELRAVHPSEDMLDYLGPNSKVFEGVLASVNIVKRPHAPHQKRTRIPSFSAAASPLSIAETSVS